MYVILTEQRPRGRPKSIKNGGTEFWKVKTEKIPRQKRGRKRIPGKSYKRKREIKPRFSHQEAFSLCLETQDLYRLTTKGGTVHEWAIHKYLEELPERYELLGDKIIRTVDTFHYVSKYTIIDGLCRSFKAMQRKFIEKYGLDGNEEVNGIHKIVLQVFRRRYFVGRLKSYDSGRSDLNIRMKWIELVINREKYYIISFQKQNSKEYTKWRMFKADWNIFKLNPTVPIKMSQEEIIEKLKTGSIKSVNKYGNPDIVYSAKEVLEILGV